MNLRCVWTIGCPAEIKPVEDEGHTNGGVPSAKGIFKQAWHELMPASPVPEVVAVSCCSQFGVTRETIQRRPVEDYIGFRDWLLTTPLDDSLSGRVFEFMWHSENPPECVSFGLSLLLTRICSYLWQGIGALPFGGGVLLQSLRHLRCQLFRIRVRRKIQAAAIFHVTARLAQNWLGPRGEKLHRAPKLGTGEVMGPMLDSVLT